MDQVTLGYKSAVSEVCSLEWVAFPETTLAHQVAEWTKRERHIELPEEWITERLARGRCFVMLDGLAEVFYPLRCVEQSNAFMADGFHDLESDNRIRWTDGNAAIPKNLLTDFIGSMNITLLLGGSTSYVDDGGMQIQHIA